MRTVRCTFALLLTATVIGIAGCSKQEQASSAKGENQLLAEPLLKKLPPSAAGFSVIDLSGDGYKQFKASPFGKAQNVKKSLESVVGSLQENGANDAQMKLLKGAVESLEKIGLISADGQYTPEKIASRIVLFAGPSSDPNMPLEAGLFMQAAQGADLSEKTKIISGFLSGSGLQVAPDKVGSTDALAVGAPEIPIKLYVASNKTSLGLAFSKANLEPLFSGADTQTLTTLKALPEFQKAASTLPMTENPVALAFVSVKRALPVLEVLAKQGSGEFKPQELPVDALIAQTNFSKQYSSRLNVAFSPRTESQTKVLAALEGGSLSPIAAKLPANTAIAISLDTKMVAKLDTFLQSLQEGADPAAIEQTKKLEGITLGLRNNTAGSPIPDVYLSIDSAGRDQTGSMLESGLGLAMSMGGQETKWLNKEIDGAPTKYFTTMIGAGAYLAYPKDSKTLLVGTSEAVIKDVLASQAGRSPAYTASLPAPMKTQLGTLTLASFYFNFPQVADLTDSVKNNLAMFTGGNSELNEALDAAKIRTWGIGIGGISYGAGVLSVESSFDFQNTK